MTGVMIAAGIFLSRRLTMVSIVDRATIGWSRNRRVCALR